jgi:hypothetical protein
VSTNWDRGIGIATTFIAVLALVVSLWEARSQRRHDRLSLAPTLSFWVNTNWDMSPQGVVIRNDGVGPAIIDSIVVYESEKRVGLWDDIAWNSVAKSLRIADTVKRRFDLGMVESGAVLRPGSELLLCGFLRSVAARTALLEQLHGRFGFVVWYRSVYGDVRRRPVLERSLPAQLRATV